MRVEMLGNDFRYGYAPTRDTTVIGAYLGQDMSAVNFPSLSLSRKPFYEPLDAGTETNFPSYSLKMGSSADTKSEKQRKRGLQSAIDSALKAGRDIADTISAFYGAEAEKARTQQELARLEREKAMAQQGINPFTGRPITAGQISTVAVVGGVAAVGIVLVLMSQRRRRRRR